MPLRATRTIHEKFKFIVRVEGFDEAIEFSDCSDLKIVTEEISLREGGALVPIKTAGLSNFPDVTLKRATGPSLDLYRWAVSVTDAVAQTGAVDPAFKKSVLITQRDRADNDLRTWALHGAWPKDTTVGSWDNNANEPVMETVVLAFDYFREGAA